MIELKWKHSAHDAIDQITKKKYSSVLENLDCPILLASISYAKAGEKKYTCMSVEYKN